MNYFRLKQGEGLANPAHSPLPKARFCEPPTPSPLWGRYIKRERGTKKKKKLKRRLLGGYYVIWLITCNPL